MNAKKISYEVNIHNGGWKPCGIKDVAEILHFAFGNRDYKALELLNGGETVLSPFGPIRQAPPPSVASVSEKAGLEAAGQCRLKLVTPEGYKRLSSLLDNAETIAGGF